MRDEIGIELEIISTAEEARLVVDRLRAAAAPAHSLRDRLRYRRRLDRDRLAAAMIGAHGGARRGAPEILGSVSLPFGVVTFTERFGGIEVTPAIYRAMVAEAEAALAPFEQTHGIRRQVARPAGADARQLGHGDDPGRASISLCRAISARWSTAAC